MSILKAPQPPPNWTHSASDILELTKQAIEANKAIQDEVGKLLPEDCSFSSVFKRLSFGETELDAITKPLTFYQNVSPDKDLRDASNEVDSQVRSFGVEAAMRLDVFEAKVNAEKNLRSSGEYDQLSAEQRRLIGKMILDGARAGLALPEEDRHALSELKKELSQVCLDFRQNCNEENGTVTFSLAELDGVPKDVIYGYKKHDAKDLYDVSFKTPDVIPIYKSASNPETRRRIFEANDNKLAINTPLLERAVDLRKQTATLLGYNNWADYVTEVKMVKNSTNAIGFIDDLEEKLRPVGMKDRETLLKLKAAECKERNLPNDGEFYLWDYWYYDRKFLEQCLDLNDDKVKEYFPVDDIVKQILEVYQTLLGVKFNPLEGGTIWHKDVQQFSVWAHDAKDESGFIGYCYLDLFTRESKFPNAAMWPLLAGYDQADGRRSYPVAAMVANLAKPTPDKPALIRHFDMVTFFHEMGHIFHELLSQTKYARFHGTTGPTDFCEAPSQMLENWCWEPKVLRKMSSHYKTKEPLSEDLIAKIIRSRYVNIGLFELKQLFLAKFDIKIHMDKEPTDYTKLWNQLRESISLMKGDKEGSGQGSFAHLMGGYDVGYYGYLYSRVFAADMYATVFKDDPLDPKRGVKYRQTILKPGYSKEELDILEDFLGRPPNNNAFMRQIFGDTNT